MLNPYTCPSCGGHLETDDKRKVMLCLSCGNTYDYDYFFKENLLKAADKALSEKNFSAAKDMYLFMLDKEPSNVNALKGLILADNGVTRIYDISQKMKNGTFVAATFNLEKYKNNCDDEALTFIEKADKVLSLYKVYIGLKKKLKRLESEEKSAVPEPGESGGGLLVYASKETLQTAVTVCMVFFVILLFAALICGINGSVPAWLTVLVVIFMIVTVCFGLAALLEMYKQKTNETVPEETDSQNPGIETDSKKSEVEEYREKTDSIIRQINDVLKEMR